MKRARSKMGLLLVLGMLTALLPMGALTPAAAASPDDLVITGVVDGPLSGGVPKVIEFYVVNDIADLSEFGFGSANNGGGSDGEEFTFPAVTASAGDYVYVASEAAGVLAFFGFDPDYTTSAAAINGDDAIELFHNGLVSDVFGDINVDGTNEPWDYMDGWASRVDGTGPDGSTFVLANWSFSGINALDGETTNPEAATPFPVHRAPVPTSPTATGTADPALVEAGANTTLEVRVVPGAFPVSTGVTVSADLTAIGGAADQALTSTDGTVFSHTAVVDATTAAGPVSLPISISDGEGRTGATAIELTVTDATPAPTELLFTQYMEGSSYNKAIEIANIGSSSVDLSAVTLELYSNGSPTPSQSTALSGALAAGDVYVMANPSASDAILAVADDTNGSVINWNGDDAIVLRDAAGVVDSIGQVGVDPGSYWSGPGVSTQDDTMCRLDSVTTGDTDPSNAFDPSVEWTGLGINATDGLGHIGCEALPVITQYVEGSSYNKALEIANLSGSDIDLSDYTVEVYFNGNETAGLTVLLSGILAAGDVYVLADDDSTQAILDVADQTIGAGLWNGNDAIVLRNSTWIIDSIGQVGFDPGSEWGDATVGTQNDTMCRLDTVLLGDMNPDDVFDPSLEWTGLGEDVFHGLGEIGCEPPVAELTPIYTIQGSGDASPLNGQTVLIEGVVTSDQQEGDFNGFFMQEVVGDGDVTTSDGILVYEGGNTVDVNVGDVVRVEGTVDEYFEMTEITSVTSVEVVGTAAVVATPISLPWATLDEPEQYEGMLITVPQALTISEYYNFGRYGEIVLTDGRQMQPTAVFDPGTPEAATLATANQLGRITLDDNRTSQNPDPAIHPNGFEFDLTNLFRGGDTVENVTGVINYSYDLYRIQPTQGADYTPANPRPAAPADVGGTLEVASFNVLNYFTTLGSRGADDAEEFDRQRTKIIAAIAEIDADIVGLMEIENNDAAIIDLVDGLNDAMGAGTYAYVDTGVVGPDEIKVALIYKPATVSLAGAHAVLDTDAFVDPMGYGDDKNRPAVAQTFTEIATGESVTVVVNHLKSKGSSCGAGDDDLEAGSCNLTRTMAAQELATWLADPANGFDDEVLIVGDLNSYDKEDPIDALKAAGYSDLIYDFQGENAYSYVFDGQWGYLDYAMANAALQERVTGTTVWHTNSDEANLIDYDMTYKQDAQDALYEPNAYRASDHDAVIVGLDLVPPDVEAPEVVAEFDKIWASYKSGYFYVDYSCTDAVDPDPECVADINGIEVEDGQKVFLIKLKWGRSWHRQIGSILFIKDTDFTLTVTGTDEAGNTATATAEPEFRTHWRWN